MRGVLTGMRSCSVRVKKLIKVGLSEGGGVQLDFRFPLKGRGCGGGAYHECSCKRNIVLACVS